MSNTKRRLITSALSLLLCFAMLLGSTFAWFTDSASSNGNIVQSGKLDVEMYWSNTLLDADSSEWNNANGAKIFDYDNWEPGYTDVKYIMVKNAGSLSFKWKLTIESLGNVGELAEVIDVYYVNPVENEVATLSGLTKEGTLDEVISSRKATSGVLLPEGTSEDGIASGNIIIAVALHMWEDAGNEYQNKSVGDGFTINLMATQYTYEGDSFGNDYDTDSEWPPLTAEGKTASAAVTADENGKSTSSVTMEDENGEVSAIIPAGVLLENGASKLTLRVKNVENSEANITVSESEQTHSVDVHIEGISKDNTVVMEIAIDALLPIGLNMGNYRFYHVEDGETTEMTLLEEGAAPAHNNYEYDPSTGNVVLYLKSFSEVALVADTENAWEGSFDYSWYDASKTDLTIANADQLAALGAIVGGMVGNARDSFKDKTVKLIADINLGDAEANNNEDIIFYPIGYYNSEYTYERTNTAITSGFKPFEGTFDGNGNTISNFYQNTWEMKGDHNWYTPEQQYYRDGMGIFGKVYGGTVKNLTVANFSSDGEIATTGVIAAYADSANERSAVFENIDIVNCNPRVYNIGNGGIVGCAGWYSKDATDVKNVPVIFKNITVDQTNKISALWGSYDVSCGGILGQYYPDSECGLSFENCHVAAVMDVNNDVCANYQYYWYRYSGMLIGTVRANTTEGGYTVADTTGITVEGCTYTMGDWNEYWYCELVANSLASYTHDHQFSRLTKIDSLEKIQDANGNWNKEGNFVIPEADNSSATCYHIFKNSEGELYQHFHDVADESNPDIYESFDLNGDGELNDLKEDRTCYYMPFNQVLNGLGYGVKPTYELGGFTENEEGPVKPYEKFVYTKVITTYVPGETITLGELFRAIVDDSKLSKISIFAAVTSATEDDYVTATYELNTSDWTESTITFSEDSYGTAKIVITDYFYCTKTVIYLELEEPKETVNTPTADWDDVFWELS